MQINKKTKEEIIYYCDYVYNNFINKEDLDKYKIPHVYFLELLFFSCLDSYKETGNYELFDSRIYFLIENLQKAETAVERMIKNEIELVGISPNGIYHFNEMPEKKVKYNRKTKKWELQNKKK